MELKVKAWLLSYGSYDEYTVLGVVLGTRDEAQAKADELTLARSGDYLVATDLVLVTVEETEVL